MALSEIAAIGRLPSIALVTIGQAPRPDIVPKIIGRLAQRKPKTGV